MAPCVAPCRCTVTQSFCIAVRRYIKQKRPRVRISTAGGVIVRCVLFRGGCGGINFIRV